MPNLLKKKKKKKQGQTEVYLTYAADIISAKQEMFEQ